MNTIAKNSVKQTNQLCMELFKKHLPVSVPADLYKEEFEQLDKYSFDENSQKTLEIYLQSLAEQNEMLVRYQIGVRRDEQSKNERIAQLVGLKIQKPDFEKLDKISLANRQKYSFGTYSQNYQQNSLVHSHYSSGFQFSPDAFINLPDIMQQKQKSFQKANSSVFLRYIRQQSFDVPKNHQMQTDKKHLSEIQKQQSYSMFLLLLPLFIGVKAFFYGFNYLLNGEMPYPVSFYQNQKQQQQESQNLRQI